MAHIYNFDSSMLVWLDETGTDKRGQLRKYGYTRFISKGERMNAIASMSTEGIIALREVLMEIIFYDFLFYSQYAIISKSTFSTDEVTGLLKEPGIVTCIYHRIAQT